MNNQPMKNAEPNLSFDSAASKVAWAAQNIDKLQAEIDVFLNTEMKPTGVFHDAQSGTVSICNAPLNAFHACLAGDIIFNLRSALDCCWMGLHRAKGPNASKATLPRGSVKSVRSAIEKAEIETAFPGVETFIVEDLGAHEDGNETLCMIGKFDNWNKHNQLILVAQATSFNNAAFSDNSGTRVYLDNVTIGGFEKQGFIRWSVDSPLKPNDNSNVSIDIFMTMREPPGEWHLMPFLRDALKGTRKGVEDFRAKFGKVP